MFIIKRPESLPSERLSQIEIYTIDDIDELDKHFTYQLKMMGVTERRNKLDIMNSFGCFDIETTTIPSNTYYNNTEEHFAFPYTYQLYIFGHAWLFRRETDFQTFLARIEKLAKENRVLVIIYVHNLSFEYQFIKSRIEIDYESREFFALQSRRIAKFQTVSGTLEFRCSYLLSNMSLEKFTENYCTSEYRKDKDLIDYEVFRFPWTILDVSEIYYSMMDVITLHKAITTIMERESDNLKTIPMTNTGYVRRSVRSACFGENTKHWKTKKQKETYSQFRQYRHIMYRTKINLEQYEMLRDAFRGGNTHANRFLSGVIYDHVGSFDFASSYPAVICCSGEFPMGLLMECTKSVQKISDFEYYCKHYWMVVTVIFKDLELRHPEEVSCPYISTSKLKRTFDLSTEERSLPEKEQKKIKRTYEGRCIFDNGRVIKLYKSYAEYTFLGCEWEIIKKQYKGQMKIVKAYYTNKGYLPHPIRQSCSEWYKLKTELKGVDGREYEYMKSKNRVNSVFGMMVQKMLNEIMEYKDGDITFRQPTEEEALQQIDDYYQMKSQKFLQYQWGVTVTALARIRHMELIEICGDDFIYGDTDSVKMLNPEKYAPLLDDYNKKWIHYADKCNVEYQAYTKKGELQIMGLADREHDYDRFITLGAKKYCAELTKIDKKTGEEYKDLEITISGVPKKIGAKLLGNIENFKRGFIFKVDDDAPNEDRQGWKKLLTYRDDCDFKLYVGDDYVRVSSCIAITRTSYSLDLSEEYSALLSESNNMYSEDDVWK